MQEATLMQTVLEQAIQAKEREIKQIDESGHIPDEQPNAPSVYTLEEEYDAWEQIAQALFEIQTALNLIEQAEQQRIAR